MKFESPDPAAATPPGSCPPGAGHRGRSSLFYASWEPLPSDAGHVVLAGRATRVPQAAVTSGIQRTVTVTQTGPIGWAHIPDLGWGRRPELHGRQGVRAGCGGAGAGWHPPTVTGGTALDEPTHQREDGHVDQLPRRPRCRIHS